MYWNTTNLLGDVVSVTEVKKLKNNTSCCKIFLSTSKKYETSSGFKNNSEIHHLVVYGKAAESCQRLRKGMKIAITGELRSSTNEVIVNHIHWGMVGQEI